jgi:hypothetical protein
MDTAILITSQKKTEKGKLRHSLKIKLKGRNHLNNAIHRFNKNIFMTLSLQAAGIPN